MISADLNAIVTLIANIALALSVVVGVIFGIAQVQAAARDRRERLTLEALRAFSDREFAELMQHVQWHAMPQTREELQGLSGAEQILFIQLAQMMESLGIMVAEGLVNTDLVDKTLGDFVVTSWEKYRPVFLDMREKNPDPFLGEYFQWLADTIAKRMADNPREPFYKTGARV
jgi:hypothetical protein